MRCWAICRRRRRTGAGALLGCFSSARAGSGLGRRERSQRGWTLQPATSTTLCRSVLVTAPEKMDGRLAR